MLLIGTRMLRKKPAGRSRLAGWLALLLLTIFFAACGSEVDFDEPPEIVYGEDVCEHCSMIINEARYAAAYVTSDGEPHRFDDIGGMLARHEEAAEEVVVFWVHDFDSEEWLKAEEAHFVKGDHITPMGFGITAFAERERAEAWAAEQGGMVMAFADLLGEDDLDEHDHSGSDQS
jgi:copper chaperone NosL